MQIDTAAPALVTGATGYVAGWIVKRLLDAGVTVHAAVRDPSKTDKIAHLVAMAEAAPGAIKFFKADLLEQGSYADAMAGCSVVFHTASPFTIDVKDPQKELVDPALLGTRNVLEQAKAVGSVRRVVVTSSCAAIYGDNADAETAPNGVFTEEIWNTSSSLAHQPYSYSKTAAEREAWRIAESAQGWDLVTINPSLVLGPGTTLAATSESFNLMRQLGDGTMKSGAPNIGIGAVDVRDVADAHLAAAYTSSAKGRHILSGHNTSMLEIAQILAETYGERFPIPRRAAPKWLLWLIGPMVAPGVTRKFVSRNVNIPWKADNSKSQRELGIRYRPLRETLNEFFAQLIDAGYITPSR